MQSEHSVLIVEDNKDMREQLTSIFEGAGYETACCEDGECGLREIAGASRDVILLDLRLPGMDGLALLEKIGKLSPGSHVIMLTGHGGVKDAVKAMKLGAVDFITKPFDNHELLQAVKCACDKIKSRREQESAGPQVDSHVDLSRLPFKSAAMRAVLKLIHIVAPTNMTVVLQGESGAGKEVIARLIHRHSRRRDGHFEPVDCGAIPDLLTESILFGHEKGAFTGADSTKEGHFELAHGGTIFLDELVNTSESVQQKMLRVVQEKKLRHLGGKKDIVVDARIIAASNMNLDKAVKAGKLRADLFYRLNEFVIDVPPLRERREDIPLLAHQFLMEANNEARKNIRGFSDDAEKLLLDAPWYGNVRELKNVIKRAALLAEGDMIAPDEIIVGEDFRLITPAGAMRPPATAPSSMNRKVVMAREDIEKEEITKALHYAGGNKAKAARYLKITRPTFYAKLKKHGVPPPPRNALIINELCNTSNALSLRAQNSVSSSSA